MLVFSAQFCDDLQILKNCKLWSSLESLSCYFEQCDKVTFALAKLTEIWFRVFEHFKNYSLPSLFNYFIILSLYLVRILHKQLYIYAYTRTCVWIYSSHLCFAFYCVDICYPLFDISTCLSAIFYWSVLCLMFLLCLYYTARYFRKSNWLAFSASVDDAGAISGETYGRVVNNCVWGVFSKMWALRDSSLMLKQNKRFPISTGLQNIHAVAFMMITIISVFSNTDSRFWIPLNLCMVLC